MYEKICPFTHKVFKKLNINQPPKCIEIIPSPSMSELNESSSDVKSYCVGLQGAALFFSSEYIKRYDGIDDRTFFGGEEMILYTNMLCANLVTVYLPEIHMYHVGGGSSTKSNSKKRKPSAFYSSLSSYILSKELLVDYKKKNKIELHLDMLRQGKVPENYQIPKS